MLQNFVRIRRGRPEDAAVLVDMIQYASEGLVTHIWSRMAEKGETAREVGLRRAAREEGAFSYRNALVLEAVGHPVAALIGYALPEEPEAIDYDSLPAIFVPPQELENMVPGTWYVNVLAVYPEFRGQGYGSILLNHAREIAKGEGCKGLSIIVSDANPGARRLYERKGYSEIASRPMVKEGWQNEGSNWVLLAQEFKQGAVRLPQPSDRSGSVRATG
jgi:ribosomal protein S18 acetylase RimI-like enzyme